MIQYNFNKAVIKSKDISVVVQGAISEQYTSNVLKSIRKALPEAEIILSTWENSDVKGLDYDVLVENQDPGAPMLFPQWKQRHNLNRQIVSTKNGVKYATRKYVLKTRTDIVHNNANFLNYFEKFKERNEKCKLLKERVLICEHFARRAECLPFHISDWVFFGLKEDIENIWNVELEPEPEYTEWFYNHDLLPQHKDKYHEHNFFRHRYCAEQYIWAHFLWRNGEKFEFDNMFDISWDNSYLTKLSFANNLVILSLEQYGISFCKGNPVVENNIYTHYDWQKLYKLYCDKNFELENKAIDYDELLGTRKYKNKINNLKTKMGRKNFLHDIGYVLRIMVAYIRLAYKTIRKSYKIISRKDEMFAYLDKYIKSLPEDVKQINILKFSLGESIIFAKIMDYITENKAELNNFAHLSCKPRHDMFKFYSNANMEFLGYGNICLKDNAYYYNNKKLTFYFGDEFWFSLWGSKEHFLEAFAKELNIDLSKIDMTKEPIISNKAKKSALEKVEQINLDLNNFIFISPEASSIDELPKRFWENIVNSYRKKGFDVFNNITNWQNYVKNTKTCNLTIEEAYVIASHAKRIIGLRSGFLELFLTLDVPMDVIYNLGHNSKNRFLVNIFENYTLQKYPKNPKLIINEYKYQNKDNQQELLSIILSDNQTKTYEEQ